MKKDSRIFVTGHNGLAGSAIVKLLVATGYQNIILKNKDELDLVNQKAVADFFTKDKPEYVFHAAARVGGMSANMKYPADFLYENLMIQTNVINESCRNNVKKLIFYGSNCAYPRMAAQPIEEDSLLTGPLEPTNEAYGVAKIAGVKLCEYYNKQYGTDFIVLIPASIYGPGDHFDEDRSHIIPTLIKNLYEAAKDGRKTVQIKTNPNKIREFLYSDDLASVSLFLMNHSKTKKNPSLRFLNVGTGKSISILDLATLAQKVIGFKGQISWDNNQPEGMPAKVLNVSRLKHCKWKYSTELEEGIKKTFFWFRELEEFKRKEKLYFETFKKTHIDAFRPHYEKGETAGEGKEVWENVSEHCLAAGIYADILSDLLKLHPETKRQVVSAAIMHDWYKKHESLALQSAIKKNTLSLKVMIDVNEKSAKCLREMGIDDEMVSLSGANTPKTVAGPETLPEKIIWYVDAMLSNTEVVPISRRFDNLEIGWDGKKRDPVRSQRNLLTSNFYRERYEGVSMYDLQRRLGDKVGKEFAKIIGYRGLTGDLPFYLEKLLRKRIANFRN